MKTLTLSEALKLYAKDIHTPYTFIWNPQNEALLSKYALLTSWDNLISHKLSIRYTDQGHLGNGYRLNNNIVITDEINTILEEDNAKAIIEVTIHHHTNDVKIDTNVPTQTHNFNGDPVDLGAITEH